jgi:glycosyltransferase involved in cell wall biosynthesis
VISRVDVVYYPSQEEVDELREKYPGRQIEQIPLYAFPLPDAPPVYAAAERRDLLFVGSFAHPPNVDALGWFLAEVLPAVLARIPDLRLHIVGRNPPPELAARAGSAVVFHGYVTDAELDRLYRACRLAIAPLRVGGGIKGKLLEAFYKGTPMITTAIGTEGIPATDRHCRIVRDLSAFAAETVALYEDADLLAALSREAHAMVVDHYSERALQLALAKGVKELAPPAAAAAA